MTRGYPRFMDRKIYKLDVKESTPTPRQVVNQAEKALSCLISRDLLFGVSASSDRCSYRAEVYNPQFVHRHFGLIQSIPELQYESKNQGSSWRKTDMLPHDIMKMSWREYIQGQSVPSYQPNPLPNNCFHESSCKRVDTWFLESAKLFLSLVFSDCPFA